MEIPNLPFGNGEQARFLSAHYRLTARELTTALRKVFISRFGIIIGIDFVPATGILHVMGGLVSPLGLGLLAVHSFYSARNIMSILYAVTGRSHSDLSVVLQAIKDKTGSRPPEYEEGGWLKRLMPSPSVTGWAPT